MFPKDSHESMEQLAVRTADFLAWLMKRPEQEVAVVTHSKCVPLAFDMLMDVSLWACVYLRMCVCGWGWVCLCAYACVLLCAIKWKQLILRADDWTPFSYLNIHYLLFEPSQQFCVPSLWTYMLWIVPFFLVAWCVQCMPFCTCTDTHCWAQCKTRLPVLVVLQQQKWYMLLHVHWNKYISLEHGHMNSPLSTDRVGQNRLYTLCVTL